MLLLHQLFLSTAFLPQDSSNKNPHILLWSDRDRQEDPSAVILFLMRRKTFTAQHTSSTLWLLHFQIIRKAFCSSSAGHENALKTLDCRRETQQSRTNFHGTSLFSLRGSNISSTSRKVFRCCSMTSSRAWQPLDVMFMFILRSGTDSFAKSMPLHQILSSAQRDSRFWYDKWELANVRQRFHT